MTKYNSEGYYDPTAYEALMRIERDQKNARKSDSYRPLVYICSPYSGNIRNNIRNARRYSRYAVEKHCIPVAPHLFFPQFMDDDNPNERETAMFMNIVLLGKCEEIWVFGDVISAGMQKEIQKAKQRNMKIRFISL